MIADGEGHSSLCVLGEIHAQRGEWSHNGCALPMRQEVPGTENAYWSF